MWKNIKPVNVYDVLEIENVLKITLVLYLYAMIRKCKVWIFLVQFVVYAHRVICLKLFGVGCCYYCKGKSANRIYFRLIGQKDQPENVMS